MLIKKARAVVIATEFNGEVLTLVDSEDWSIWLRDIKDSADNTIKTFMSSMNRFWEWTLYNPMKVSERFPAYQARYRKDLRTGFEINIKVPSEEFQDELEVTVCSCKPLEKSTVNKELAGINSYFYFTEESALIDDHRFINHLYERHRTARSFLAGIQIKKSSVAMKASSKKLKYLPPYKKVKNRSKIKYFPLELFDELLSISKPREKLLYLLCGACSARVGQALNLTLYDIDYDKEEVWLIDPKSDDKDIYDNKRKAWLKSEYNIDMDKENKHNTLDLQFKYPIPLYHEPIYWISDKYKKLFFKTLNEYRKSSTYVSEYVRTPPHPFLFTTRTGGRVHQRDALSRLKTAMKKLFIKYPKKEYGMLFDLGMHSLRHMFGHARAELYAHTQDDAIIYITMNEMGHGSLESTLVYFNISRETMKKVVSRYTDEIQKENILKGKNHA